MYIYIYIHIYIYTYIHIYIYTHIYIYIYTGACLKMGYPMDFQIDSTKSGTNPIPRSYEIAPMAGPQKEWQSSTKQWFCLGSI